MLVTTFKLLGGPGLTLFPLCNTTVVSLWHSYHRDLHHTNVQLPALCRIRHNCTITGTSWVPARCKALARLTAACDREGVCKEEIVAGSLPTYAYE